MRKQQQQKNYRSRIRSSGGQTTLQSFLFKPRVADGELNPSRRPRSPLEDEEEPFSPPAPPPKRETIRVTSKTIKEKASAFSSVGSSSGKNGGREGGEASTLNTAVLFKRFNSSNSSAAARVECGGSVEVGEDPDDGGGGGCEVRLDVEDIGSRGRECRKRKSTVGGGDEHMSRNANHVVVLGDDPKPRPPPAMRRRGRPGGRGGGDHGLYNHYASGGGLWHEDREGVDGSEVGWTDDMWEGMGSITLGGMEWH